MRRSQAQVARVAIAVVFLAISVIGRKSFQEIASFLADQWVGWETMRILGDDLQLHEWLVMLDDRVGY